MKDPPGRVRAGALRQGGRRRPPSERTVHGNVREAAAWVIERTLSSRSPAAGFLESAKERCDPYDHGLLRELVLGTLTWCRRIDHVIAQAANRRFDQIENGLRAPLRLAVYQLLFLDRMPHHAIVHEAVEQARHATHRGGASFANAVLRRVARDARLDAWPVEERDPVRRIAVEHSHPDFLVRRWVEQFGERRTRELLVANNRPKPLQLLAFRHRGGRELLAEALIDEGVEVSASELAPLGLEVLSGQPLHSESFRRGGFYVQDTASQAVALLPPPAPGERILDLAAAPGGKSFSLIAFEPAVRLVAADASLPRLGVLRANLERLELEVPVLAMDAGSPAVAGVFDRVVCDLPCTGTGTLRKNPELKWRISEAEVGRLAREAGRMLEGAAELVVPGGLLAVITCSLELEENDAVVDRFLAAHPEFAPLALEGRLPPPLQRHVCAPGRWQVLPAGVHDGFTVHVLARGDRRPAMSGSRQADSSAVPPGRAADAGGGE
ncbi:MAG TPA: transcription antitermination factor NusB [Thermoanaerobaculia bacterium]|nr:transcription antitermination factor NusB [Thermoanaerobaculia bacterium]